VPPRPVHQHPVYLLPCQAGTNKERSGKKAKSPLTLPRRGRHTRLCPWVKRDFFPYFIIKGFVDTFAQAKPSPV
jgi:hypothetical protein